MEILFLLAGLLLLAIGIAVVVTEARLRRGAWTVPGQVIGFSTGKGGGSGGGSYSSVAEYAGLDGCTRYVESSVGSSAPLGAVGDPVVVLVDREDPEKAALKSPLTYVIGAALALMGLASCIAFFAVFRATTFSIGSAVGVVIWGAYKFRGSIREKPMSLQAWRKYKDEALRPRVFTDATKATIPWADAAALQAAIANQQKVNRFAVPVLLLAGVGLLFLGAHLHRKTAMFLERAVGAPGVVVAMATNDSSDGHTYAPVVEFDHQGRKYRFKDSISSNPPSYRAGQSVAVLYDPEHPSDARIDRGRWNKAVPILSGGFGALICLLGLWILQRRGRGLT